MHEALSQEVQMLKELEFDNDEAVQAVASKYGVNPELLHHQAEKNGTTESRDNPGGR